MKKKKKMRRLEREIQKQNKKAGRRIRKISED
jgi:hypothetical protein